ncbi:MAG: ImmA/IrrE family metallo-endopeptidase, partial [Bacteroidales bacterium]|nr:ImmA/IrrE family metallo-endopeptidase [Bacteroidales bacterium]
MPEKKKRWAEAHEIGHSILSWHQVFLHGDPNSTLSIGCKEKIESEANYTAGQILFPQAIFRLSLPQEHDINIRELLKTH